MSKIIYGPTGNPRLLKTHEQCDISTFDDLLHCCSVTVENAMLKSGLMPGTDYSKIEIFWLAMPLAMAMKTDRTTITTGTPDSHPQAGLSNEEYLSATEKLANSIEAEVFHEVKAYGAPMMSQTIGGKFRKRGGVTMQKAAIQAAHSLAKKGILRKTNVGTHDMLAFEPA